MLIRHVEFCIFRLLCDIFGEEQPHTFNTLSSALSPKTATLSLATLLSNTKTTYLVLEKKYFQEVSGYNSAIDQYQKEIDNSMLNKTSLTRIASDMGDKVTTSQSSWRIRHFLHDNWLRKIPFSKKSQRLVGLYHNFHHSSEEKKINM